MFTKPQVVLPPLNLGCFNLGGAGFQPRLLSVPTTSSSSSSTSEMDLIPRLGKLFFISQQNKAVESDNKDGFDVVSPEPKPKPDHLVIMVNGIIGRLLIYLLFH